MKEESFQEWYERFEIEHEISPNQLSANAFGLIVWEHQQKKVDKLEQKLSLLENTGMIGSSPAQFMEKISELESKLARAVEALSIAEGFIGDSDPSSLYKKCVKKNLEEIGDRE